MKRKHIIIAGIIASIILCGFLLVHFAGNQAAGIVNEMADRQTVLQGKLEIGNFTADVSGNVVFKDMVWTDPQGEKIAVVPSMNVSANLFDILKGDFGAKSIKSIIVEKPEFLVNYSDKEGLNIIKLINFPQEQTDKPTEFRGIFEINDAKVNLNMNGQELDFNKVKMQANLKEFPLLKFMLQGKSGEADLIGNITKEYDKTLITAEVKKIPLTELMKVLPSFGELSITDGAITTGKLKAEHKDQQWIVDITGAVKNISGKAVGYNITGGEGSFIINNVGSEFKDVKALVEGQPVTMAGKIIFHKETMPTYDLDIATPSFKIDAISPGLGITDSITADGKVTGAIDKPIINGKFSMEQLNVVPLYLTNINGQYQYTEGMIKFNNTYANVYSGTIGVTGTVNAATKDFNLHVSGNGLDSGAVTETQIRGPLSFEANATGTGSAESAVAAGNFAIGHGNFAGVPFNYLTGNFTRANSLMSFSNIAIGTALGEFSSNAVMDSTGKIKFDQMKESFKAPPKEEVVENIRKQIDSSIKKELGKLFH